MGRPLPDLHGREGVPSVQSSRRGQEAPGPVSTLRLRQRDWRSGAGENAQCRASVQCAVCRRPLHGSFGKLHFYYGFFTEEKLSL